MKLTASGVLLFLCFLAANQVAEAQVKRVILNSPNALYEMTGAGGTCNYSGLPDLCPGLRESVYSTALFNQTLYILSFNSNRVYSVLLGTPGSCRFVGNFPSESRNPSAPSTINAFTVDKHGNLYGVSVATNSLYRLNPNTGESVLVGKLPVSPGGDLVFYGDKLILATAATGLYEINLDDPSASTQFMSTGNYTFWGLISFPSDCVKNKVYGFAPGTDGTQLVELDLENKTVGAVVCSIPIVVYDAASIVETGNTLGIWVDSILIEAPCSAEELTGNASILGYSATPGDLKFSLNNGMQNASGKFENLGKGNYQVRITNDIGCSKDTFFTIQQGMSNADFAATDPRTCQLPDGSILIDAVSNYQPVVVRVNDDPPQTNLQLRGLGAGVYKLSVSDQGACHVDTTIILKSPQRPDFLGQITTEPGICESASGNVHVGINGDATGITASLNGGPFKPITALTNLSPGRYRLTILNNANCFYDTLLQIGRLTDPAPQISFDITDQFCYNNTGKLVVHATGAGSPFEFAINNSNQYDVENHFENLWPGIYRIGIRNSHLCYWDSVAVIKPYIPSPVNFTLHKKDPTCRAINSGELRINISGAEMPYTFKVDNKTYASGELALLPPGKYPIDILNKNQCLVEATNVDLGLHYEPGCDRVSIPNAFSPNNDGNNDLFRPIHSAYITQVSMTIYNRYGQVVFRSSPAQPAWDGKLNGRPVDTGNYVWVMTWLDFSGKPRKTKGLVLVLR